MSRTIDILGVGALNVDRIFSVSMTPVLLRSLSAICPGITWGGEIAIDEEQFIEVEKLLQGQPRTLRLGGSAYNAIRTFRSIDTSTRIGFIGTIGADPAAEGFSDWFERYGIAVPFTTRATDRPSGGCISFEHDGERTLVTTRGANDRTGEMLTTNMAAVVKWSGAASMIHLSSFLDDRSSAVLGEFLGFCQANNPDLRVTIDPGAHWAARYAHDSSVNDLLNRADLLFVNQQEFDALWGKGEPSLHDHSSRLGNGRGPSVTVLLKRPDGLTIFDRTGAVLFDTKHLKLEKDELANTTGAGDVFAGAFLASLQIPRLTDVNRMAAAMAVVRASLRRGRSAEQDFARVFASAAGLSS